MTPEEQEEFRRRRNRLIDDLFLARADEDYAAARLLVLNGLLRSHLWAAAQAVEKYVKAALLLRGQSSKFGHDKVWAKYRGLAEIEPGLLPTAFLKSKGFDKKWWCEEKIEAYFGRLRNAWSAENRYNLHRSGVWLDDRHKLDQLVWAIRRLCCPVLADLASPGLRKAERARLQSDASYSGVRPFRLPTPAKGIGPMSAEDALRFDNHPFAAEGASPPSNTQHGMGLASPFGFALADIIRGDSSYSNPRELSGDPVTKSLCVWLVENVKLPKDLKKKLAEHAKRSD